MAMAEGFFAVVDCADKSDCDKEARKREKYHKGLMITIEIVTKGHNGGRKVTKGQVVKEKCDYEGN